MGSEFGASEVGSYQSKVEQFLDFSFRFVPTLCLNAGH